MPQTVEEKVAYEGRSAGRRRLGQILLSQGALTEPELEDAIAARVSSGGRRERLGETIVRLGLASEAQVAMALAEQFGLEYLDVEALPIHEDAISMLPAALARRHAVLPLEREPDGTLIVATADPTDLVASDDVRLASGVRRLLLVVVPSSVIDAALARAYGSQREATELLDELSSGEDEEAVDADDLARAAFDAPVVRLAENILVGALDTGASDVHIEPASGGTTVRYRIDGVLREVMTVPRSASGSLVSRLKLMAGMDIAERRRPQDGRSKIKGAHEVDLRVSTMPSMFGETVVVRLLRKGDERLELDDLGLNETQTAQVMSAIERPQGLILLTGPTGSGKTSSLYAFLTHLARETTNIITLEDPVEYQLDGVNQTQINEQIGLTFARSLRSVLRQDPDIVMVGEIRDPETAELALQASLTGHLVFSTLHTNDAPGAIVRLRDLGVPPYLIASSLEMVVAQRLVRQVCDRCGVVQEPTQRQVDQLYLSVRDIEEGQFSVGAGCEACGQTGYRGRLGLFEVLTVDAHVRELVAANASESAFRQAARLAGMRSVREDGLAKAKAGITTLEEVLRVTPSDVSDESACPICAQAIEPDFASCPWCGADLRPESCKACDRPLQRGWQVCPNCGTPREQGRPTSERIPRLLVVDDDPSVRSAIAAMLYGAFEVVEAADGKQALEAIGEQLPDAALVDISMPGMDGYQFTRELRARPVTMHLPVMIMTGRDDADAELEGLRAGADDHLVKPLDMDILVARLDALLRRTTA